MNKLQRVLVLLVIFSGVNMPSVWAVDVKQFEKESYQKILDSNKTKPFLLVMWSIDCPPCHDELMLLGHYLKEKPDFKVILISTDSAVNIDEIQQILLESQLHNQESWVFSEAPPNQLRYAIDPRWYGELPRSYLYNQCHERKAFSGKLTTDLIDSAISNGKNC